MNPSAHCAPWRTDKAFSTGHLLFRPVGLLIFARVVRALVDTGLSLNEAVKKLS